MVLALIADLAGSRQVPRRAALQRKLERTLADVSAGHPGLASPYTLTLGDEFQAVYRDPGRVFVDILQILASIHPVKARFSLGVGELATAINPHQALGMDGPAFHRARATLGALKRQHRVWAVADDPPARWALANHSLAYIGHHLLGWDRNRLLILRRRLLAIPAAEIADELRISKVAVHKNIRVGALDEIGGVCHEIAASLTHALQA